MSAPWLPAIIVDISSHPGFPADRIEQASLDKALRKILLRQYRWDVVRPVLRQVDREAFLAVASRPLPGFNISFPSFQPEPERISIEFLAFDSGYDTWLWYRLWALCWMTGCWPLPIRGGSHLPAELWECPRCKTSEVTAVHAICDCSGYSLEREWARSKCTLPSASNAHAFLLELFGRCDAPQKREIHVALVGKILVEGCELVAL